jgi:hypothetical protein
MKHLKKFNESESTKYKMELKDYFYDFSDNGFTIDIEDNVIKGKYKGNIDSVDILDTFLEVVTKLKHYYGIAKTSFYNTKTTTSFTIEVQHKPNENSIEVTLSASNTKLILNVVNYNYSPGYLTLYCIDILNNKKVSVGWNYDSFRIGSRIGKIDLVNVEKVLKNILNGEYRPYNDDYVNNQTLKQVAEINPNTLVNI